MKENILTLTAKDFKIEYYRGSGNGGQKKAKTSSACRISHEPSGATGTSQDSRSQTANREAAFRRMVESKRFQTWLKMEISSRLLENQSFEKKLDESLQEKNLRVEYVHTVSCDGPRCQKREQFISSEGALLVIPEPWISELTRGEHLTFCSKKCLESYKKEKK